MSTKTPITVKVKSWATISDEAKRVFDAYADWMQHFSLDIIEEAQEYYAASLQKDEYGRAWAVTYAWHYAQGASRFMHKPQSDTTSQGS